MKYIASTPALFTACTPVAELTAPSQPVLPALWPWWNAPHLPSQSSQLEAPAQLPPLSISAAPVVKYVVSTPALSGVPAVAAQGHRCSACRVGFCQRQRLNTSSQRQLSPARLNQRSTASKHRRPHRISAAVKYFEPTPVRVRTPTCSGMKKNLKSIPNRRKFLTKNKEKSKPDRRVIDEKN